MRMLDRHWPASYGELSIPSSGPRASYMIINDKATVENKDSI